jgi:hypothetical protein
VVMQFLFWCSINPSQSWFLEWEMGRLQVPHPRGEHPPPCTLKPFPVESINQAATYVMNIWHLVRVAMQIRQVPGTIFVALTCQLCLWNLVKKIWI